MSVLEDLSEEERYLVSILLDESGVDQAEFLWTDERNPDNIFRCYDYQYPWYRSKDKLQIDQCGRAVGKSLGIQMRAFAFPFTNPGEELLITAPELIHLEPVTKYVEERIMTSRLSREFLNTRGGQRGINKRPFEVKFINGSKIIGRIPQKDGKGIKGMHPKKLEMDEAQDYPDAGWIELMETLKYDQEGATWRSHGVTRGVRDYFHKLTQPESGWTVHRITAMHRNDWSSRERHDKAEFYGGRHSPDYRRNIMGLHGDAQNPMFVLTRLMACVDTVEESEFNASEYTHLRINDERLRETGLAIGDLIDLPARHLTYERFWIGMDVGMTNHPSEIVVLAEETKTHTGGAKKGAPDMRLKLIARIHLERISSADQRAVLERLYDFYHPKCIAMDKTGLGLPIYQEIKSGEHHGLANVLKGYNFSEKVLVGYERELDDDGEPIEINANVLEYSSDRLRGLVDQEKIRLPWDIDLLKEFQGQTYVVKHSTTNPYGKKEFNKGKFHTLDATRMAALGWALHDVEAFKPVEDHEPVPDIFMLA